MTGDVRYLPTSTWLKDSKSETAVFNCSILVSQPLASFLCSAPSCSKVSDEVLCTSHQYAAGHLAATILGKSDVGQTQNILRGLFMDLGLPWDLGYG